jgi:hypothetical protein
LDVLLFLAMIIPDAPRARMLARCAHEFGSSDALDVGLESGMRHVLTDTKPSKSPWSINSRI